VVTPEMIDEMHTSGTFTNHTLNRALAKEGMLERAVPGMGMGDPLELWVLFNELEKAALRTTAYRRRSWSRASCNKSAPTRKSRP
jgi:hypothetical protein